MLSVVSFVQVGNNYKY